MTSIRITKLDFVQAVILPKLYLGTASLRHNLDAFFDFILTFRLSYHIQKFSVIIKLLKINSYIIFLPITHCNCNISKATLQNVDTIGFHSVSSVKDNLKVSTEPAQTPQFIEHFLQNQSTDAIDHLAVCTTSIRQLLGPSRVNDQPWPPRPREVAPICCLQLMKCAVKYGALARNLQKIMCPADLPNQV